MESSRPEEPSWQISLIVFLVAALGVTVWALLDYSKPPKQIKPSTLPSSEKVGEAVGKSSKGFIRGFYKGVRE